MYLSPERELMDTMIYRKPTHTGHYLNSDSNHPPHVRRGVVRSLVHRGSTICKEQEFLSEVGNIKHELALNGYPLFFIDSNVKGPMVKRWPEMEKKIPLGTAVIPYVKGVSEKFIRIGNRHNIRTVFKTSHILRRSLVKMRLDRDPLDTRHCVCSIPSECSQSNMGEMGRQLGACLREHQNNLKQGLMEKSKLAQHAYNEGHCIIWKKAKILQTELNCMWRK
jgi:hypothetical protein